MTSKHWNRAVATIAELALLVAIVATGGVLLAQAPARFVGTITAINGNTLTVKTDAGDVRHVELTATAVLKQLAPGQKDLSTAATIQASDLATGDRVFVKLDPEAQGAVPQALQVVAMKQSDITQQQQKEREDWQRRGVGGLVKSVDATAGVVTLTTGAGATAKTVSVHIAKTTRLLRYAPTSTRFADATPAPLDAIQPGDQFRARGNKNADGTSLDAEEAVSGSFRNISGTVTALDASGSTLTVKDLITKKPVTIHVTADAQMRRLPDMMARMIAARLKGGAPAGGGAAQGGQPGAAGSQGASQWAGQGNGQSRAGAGGGGDLQQALSRAPAIKLTDLQKGDAVMVVSAPGTSDVTAITLLAGVEPLLEAPAAANLLANWSMGSGGADATAQ